MLDEAIGVSVHVYRNAEIARYCIARLSKMQLQKIVREQGDTWKCFYLQCCLALQLHGQFIAALHCQH